MRYSIPVALQLLPRTAPDCRTPASTFGRPAGPLSADLLATARFCLALRFPVEADRIPTEAGRIQLRLIGSPLRLIRSPLRLIGSPPHTPMASEHWCWQRAEVRRTWW